MQAVCECTGVVCFLSLGVQIDHVYSGALYGPTVEAMKACDPAGPLMINIVKLFPTPNGEQFLAFGRVFSGTAVAGQTVRVLGTSYVFTSLYG